MSWRSASRAIIIAVTLLVIVIALLVGQSSGGRSPRVATPTSVALACPRTPSTPHCSTAIKRPSG